MALFKKLQGWLDGKKAYFSAAAMGIPALAHIAQALSAGGLGAIPGILKSEDWAELTAALAIIFVRGAIAKTTVPPATPATKA